MRRLTIVNVSRILGTYHRGLCRFFMCCVLRSSIACALPSALCLPCVIDRHRILQHFVSCTSPFALHFSVLYRLAPCLCTLPFVLCLLCVIGRRRILQHFVPCTSPFALHSLCCVVWRLASALCLSCFASPALSIDTGFFSTSSLALHLSRFISLCCVVWRLASYISSLSFLLSILRRA